MKGFPEKGFPCFIIIKMKYNYLKIINNQKIYFSNKIGNSIFQ